MNANGHYIFSLCDYIVFATKREILWRFHMSFVTENFISCEFKSLSQKVVWYFSFSHEENIPCVNWKCRNRYHVSFPSCTVQGLYIFRDAEVPTMHSVSLILFSISNHGKHSPSRSIDRAVWHAIITKLCCCGSVEWCGNS